MKTLNISFPRMGIEPTTVACMSSCATTAIMIDIYRYNINLLLNHIVSKNIFYKNLINDFNLKCVMLQLVCTRCFNYILYILIDKKN